MGLALAAPAVQVKVADRTVIVTTDAETRVAEPKGLQQLIDAAVADVPSGQWVPGVPRWRALERFLRKGQPLQSLLEGQLGVDCEALSARLAAHAGRSFVRPSGTEDVVRVYAEAATQAEADALAAAVGRLVYRHAGGVGEEP